MDGSAAYKVTMSTGVEIVDRGDGRFSLVGAVDFDNAGQVMSAGQKYFADHDSIIVDTSAAGVSGTAGLAVMMEWASWCDTRDIKLVYEGIHAKALAVAELNGVTMMLPVSAREGAHGTQGSIACSVS